MQTKKSRSATRVYAMEIIYQHFLTNSDVSAILERYSQKKSVDKAYLDEIVKGALAKKVDVESKVKQVILDRTLDEVSDVEFAILRMSVYELMFMYDVPYKVVINEAINLAKKYGAQDSHKFVNSVLDKIASDVRSLECKD